MTEAEIKAKYKALHDELSESYCKRHELTKEEFDIKHGKIWNDMEAELIDKGFMMPPKPPRDLEAEVDELKAKVELLEKVR